MRVVLLGFALGALGTLLLRHFYTAMVRNFPPPPPAFLQTQSPAVLLVRNVTGGGGRSKPALTAYSLPTAPRVFCWVPSRDASGPLLERIYNTWLSTCDGFIFSSTQSNPELNVVKIDYPTNEDLWNMIHPAWSYIEKHYIDDFDWFVKLDDDSYFSGPNFKSLVRDLNPEDYYYLGHTVHEVNKRMDDPRALFNLGAGHALSRASLRRMALHLPNSEHPNKAPRDKQCPRWRTWAEDVHLGECLYLAGGIGHPNNTRDAWGRENFMAFLPESNFLTVRRPDSSSWFWKAKPAQVGSGVSCCSSRPVGWHGFKKGESQQVVIPLHYMLYNVHVDPQAPPPPPLPPRHL